MNGRECNHRKKSKPRQLRKRRKNSKDMTVIMMKVCKLLTWIRRMKMILKIKTLRI
jgi:hypothetical protein